MRLRIKGREEPWRALTVGPMLSSVKPSKPPQSLPESPNTFSLPLTVEEANVCGILELGQGNPSAGINALAMMCSVLAGISARGSGLAEARGADRESSLLGGGCDFLSLGNHSSLLLREEIFQPLRSAQNQFVTKKHDLDLKLARQASETSLLRREPIGLYPFDAQPSDFEACTQGVGGSLEEQRCLLEPRKELHLGGGLRRSLVFVEGSDPGQIGSLLPFAHDGKIAVSVAVSDSEQLRDLAKLARTVRIGTTTTGPYNQWIRGNLWISCSKEFSQLLGPVDSSQMPWSSDLLWLSDRIPDSFPPTVDVISVGLLVAYRKAVSTLMIKRWLDPRPMIFHEESLKFQVGFVQWLTALGADGSALAHRHLLPTLIFGLRALGETGEISIEAMRILIRQSISIAKWLVKCSLAAVTDAIGSEDRFRRRELAKNILLKLMAQPGSTREIQRRFHKQSAQRCTEGLAYLEEASLIELKGHQWSIKVERKEAMALFQQML